MQKVITVRLPEEELRLVRMASSASGESMNKFCSLELVTRAKVVLAAFAKTQADKKEMSEEDTRQAKPQEKLANG